MHIFKSIHRGDSTLAEKEQIKLKRDLDHVKQGSPKNRSREQEKTRNNIKNLYESREKIFQLFDDYARSIPKNIYDSKQKETGLKILTPNQMLKRLPIALAQINSEIC